MLGNGYEGLTGIRYYRSALNTQSGLATINQQLSLYQQTSLKTPQFWKEVHEYKILNYRFKYCMVWGSGRVILVMVCCGYLVSGCRTRLIWAAPKVIRFGQRNSLPRAQSLCILLRRVPSYFLALMIPDTSCSIQSLCCSMPSQYLLISRTIPPQVC